MSGLIKNTNVIGTPFNTTGAGVGTVGNNHPSNNSNIHSFLVNRPSPTIAQANGGACQPSIVQKEALLKSDTSKAI